MKTTLVLLLLVGLAACQPAATPTDMLDSEEHDVGELAVDEADEHMNGRWVEYNGYRDYLVTPGDGPHPGVVMIHEWWGLNQNIKNMANDLAAEGYTVLAVDLYDGRVADTFDDALAYATGVRDDPDPAITHLQAAAAYLRAQGTGAVASMGWCFGGQQSLSLALNDDLDATVIYYGSLVTDESQLQSIDWPVLGVFGEEDGSIPVSDVRAFEMSLDALGVENEIYIYDGVGHAFANPSNAGHDPEKTADAWAKTVAFLERNLKQ